MPRSRYPSLVDISAYGNPGTGYDNEVSNPGNRDNNPGTGYDNEANVLDLLEDIIHRYRTGDILLDENTLWEALDLLEGAELEE